MINAAGLTGVCPARLSQQCDTTSTPPRRVHTWLQEAEARQGVGCARERARESERPGSRGGALSFSLSSLSPLSLPCPVLCLSRCSRAQGTGHAAQGRDQRAPLGTRCGHRRSAGRSCRPSRRPRPPASWPPCPPCRAPPVARALPSPALWGVDGRWAVEGPAGFETRRGW